MTIKYLPVLPANLRPIVKLQDKTIITTDLNSFYSKIIISNNKIGQFKNLSIPGIFIKNEKYLLQQTIDSLINGKEQKKRKFISTLKNF